MKTTRILSIAMTLAMVVIAGLHASVTEHQPPAPLPEFKTPEQLAKWRAEQNQKTQTAASSQEGGVFYTGKPYLAESGSYAFMYREYNPEMGRWTTVDPSGFPDGPNNRLYIKNNWVQLLDDNGLAIVKPGIADWSSAKVTNLTLASFKYTSTEYDIDTSEGKIWDSYIAKWSAKITMKFDNPFKTSRDVATKTRSSSVVTTTSGSIVPIAVPALIPGPGIKIDTSILDSIVSQIVETAWTSTVSLIPNADKLGISKSEIETTVIKILDNQPTISTLAKEFPQKKYPRFTE